MNRSLGARKGKAEGKSFLEATANRKAKNKRRHSFREQLLKIQHCSRPSDISLNKTSNLIKWSLSTAAGDRQKANIKITDCNNENKTSGQDGEAMAQFQTEYSGI